MNFEKKVRVENPYGVKIFPNFHFQNSTLIILKKLAKKFFKKINSSNCHVFPFPFPVLDCTNVQQPPISHFIQTVEDSKLFKIFDIFIRLSLT